MPVIATRDRARRAKVILFAAMRTIFCGDSRLDGPSEGLQLGVGVPAGQRLRGHVTRGEVRTVHAETLNHLQKVREEIVLTRLINQGSFSCALLSSSCMVLFCCVQVQKAVVDCTYCVLNCTCVPACK